MSDASLLIKVSADVNNAITNFGKLDGALDVTNLSLQDSIKMLDRFYQALNRTSDPTAIKAYEASITTLESHIADLEAEALKAAEAQKALNAAFEAGTQSGFRIAGSITQQRTLLTDLGRAVTGTGFSVRSLVSNISLLGPVGVIAAGALYLIGKALFEQTDAEKKASDAAAELKKNLDNLKSASDITGEASGGAEGEISKINALASAVQNTNLTYRERQNALDQLRETNKAYFGDLTLEADSLKTLAGRVTEYSNALIQEAVIKGFTEEISKQTIEYNKQADILLKLKSAKEAADQAVASGPQGPSINLGTTAGGSQNESDVLAARAGAATNAFEKQRDAVEALATDMAKLRGNIEDAVNAQLKFKPLTSPKDGSGATDNSLAELKKYIDDSAKINADAEEKEIIAENDKYNKVFADLVKFHHETELATEQHEKNLVDIRNKYIALNAGIIAKAFADEKAKELKATQDGNLKLQNETEAYLDKSQSIGEDATTRAINAENEKYKKLLEAHMLGDGEIEAIEKQHQINLQKITQAGQDAKDEDQIGINISNFKLTFDQNLASASYKKAVSEVLKNIQNEKDVGNIKLALKISANISEATKKQLQKDIGDDIKTLISKVAEASIEGIGTAIGNLASGIKDPFASVLKNIGAILGDGLIAIGKKLIETSAFMVAINKAIAALNIEPELGAVVGIAAIAAGTLLKNEVTQTAAHAFADGGIVTGPTLGLVGEAGPEVIFPLSKLNQFVKSNSSGGQVVTIRGQISGNNLNLLQKRNARQQRLVA